MNIDIFAEHFSELEDPRQSAKVNYPLFYIVFLTLCAVIAGCEGWEDIENFGENRLDWLQERGFFKLGLPVDKWSRLTAKHYVARTIEKTAALLFIW